MKFTQEMADEVRGFESKIDPSIDHFMRRELTALFISAIIYSEKQKENAHTTRTQFEDRPANVPSCFVGPVPILLVD